MRKKHENQSNNMEKNEKKIKIPSKKSSNIIKQNERTKSNKTKKLK